MSYERESLSSGEPPLFDGSQIPLKTFRMANGGKPTPVAYQLHDAPHYFYISDQAFVVRVIREFLLSKVEN